MPHWTADDIPDLTGKTALITGANSGLGLACAQALAANNARVILACRGQAKAEAAMDLIRAQTPTAELEFLQLDLSDLASIRGAAQDICARHARLDILINNAGIMGLPRGETRDGFERVFGVNHLGHFAFTAQLLDVIRATAGARIVTVSSVQAKNGHLPLDDLHWEQRRYRRGGAYAQAKLANLSFALELDRRLRGHNIDAISVAAHPGYSATAITAARDGQPSIGRWLWEAMGRLGNVTFAQSVEGGTLPILRAATAAGVQGGEYYGPDGLGGFRGNPVSIQPCAEARDGDIAARLWQLSEQMTEVKCL